MHKYGTDVLHFSDAQAYFRITAARASRRFPALLTMLQDGRIHLSGIEVLAPYLTRENCDELLAHATHKSKRELKELVAALAPKPDVPCNVRKLPEPKQQTQPTQPRREQVDARVSPAESEATPAGRSSNPPARAGRERDKHQGLCRAHNLLRAESDYGKDMMASYRQRGAPGRVSEPTPAFELDCARLRAG